MKSQLFRKRFALLIALFVIPLFEAHGPSPTPSMTSSTKKPTEVLDVTDTTLLLSPSSNPSESFFPSCSPSMSPVKSFKSSKKSKTQKSFETKTSSTRRLKNMSKGLSKGSKNSCELGKGKGHQLSTKAPMKSGKGTNDDAYSPVFSSYSAVAAPKSNGIKKSIWCMVNVSVIFVISFDLFN